MLQPETSTILLAIDESEFSRAALDEVIHHLRPESTRVHVLHVLELDRMVPPSFDFARGVEYGADVASHLQVSRDNALWLVEVAAQRLREAGFSSATAVREGDPRHAILNHALDIKCDCIVMGSHGRRGVDRFFMGSVSDSVVRHAHCSVFVVRRRDAGTPAIGT
jgi:nucleotide-binding universal stress UspA family protein